MKKFAALSCFLLLAGYTAHAETSATNSNTPSSMTSATTGVILLENGTCMDYAADDNGLIGLDTDGTTNVLTVTGFPRADAASVNIGKHQYPYTFKPERPMKEFGSWLLTQTATDALYKDMAENEIAVVLYFQSGYLIGTKTVTWSAVGANRSKPLVADCLAHKAPFTKAQ